VQSPNVWALPKNPRFPQGYCVALSGFWERLKVSGASDVLRKIINSKFGSGDSPEPNLLNGKSTSVSRLVKNLGLTYNLKT
jgi:hypothetical protein